MIHGKSREKKLVEFKVKTRPLILYDSVSLLKVVYTLVLAYITWQPVSRR